MNTKLRILFFYGLLLATIFGVRAQNIDPQPKKLQEIVKSVIGKGYAASVFIAEYDTLAMRQTGKRFSGVVVTEDGVILTAGHACRTNGAYWVTFPDNKQYLAIGAGRIAGFDAAVMKIRQSGSYPYAEMGWSSSMKINEPCVSIAYPASINPKQAVVRFGHVVAHDVQRAKMMQTTCLMEPGDSGGPVFDLYGRVVGIRSNILPDLRMNFDVPIDKFRLYWSSLLKPIDYQFLPKQDELPVDTLANSRVYFTNADHLALQLAELGTKLEKYCLMLTNPQDTLQAIGTLINIAGLNDSKAKKSYAIGKSSLIADHVTARYGKNEINAKVLYRDRRSDLVLIELEKRLKTGISISETLQDKITVTDLGDILISPNPTRTGKISVLGSVEFDLPKINSGGFLGVTLVDKGNKTVFEVISPNSPAHQVGLMVGDSVVTINGITINTADEFLSEMRKTNEGDEIKLTYKRNQSLLHTDVMLGKRTDNLRTIADQYKGGRSVVVDGFNHAFIHDGAIFPWECGNPIFDINGKFRGINMARYSRTSTVAVSPAEILTFVKAALSSLGKGA